VVEIQIFSTILKTPTGKKIIMPNGKMTEGPIENIAENSEVQAEIILLLQANTSFEKLQQVAQIAANQCPFALPGRNVEIRVAGISRDDMKTEISVWTLGQHYDDTITFFYAALRDSLAATGIELAKERRRDLV
jgi:small conductance mechanosensitive channel